MQPTEQERKGVIRERVWAQLEAANASPRGVRGRIPDFVGSDQAADRLTTLDAWQQAQTMKANPDRAQQPVRAHALRDGKLLFMAVPNLANIKPFYRLDPAAFDESPERAASRQAAAELGSTVAVDELPPIDFIVCGSVAVNRKGVRIGKGAGYSDLEMALLAEVGRLQPTTTIVTTVHTLQVIEEDPAQASHDFTVDFIVTPEEIIRCTMRHRPEGVEWESITAEMVKAMPVLGIRP